jgi:hypothetical protein
MAGRCRFRELLHRTLLIFGKTRALDALNPHARRAASHHLISSPPEALP